MNRLISKRTDGYSLPFAILIFIIVIILSSSLILTAYQKEIVIYRVILTEKLVTNANSALNILIAHSEKYPYNQEIHLSLYDSTQDSVILSKEQWGAFDILQATAHHKGQKKTLSAMIGSYTQDSSSIALFIPESGKSIALVGNVNIIGNCKLPEAKFTEGNVEGKIFTGKPIKSLIKNSECILPPLNENITKLTLNQAMDTYMEYDSKIVPIDDFKSDSLSVSFIADSTITLYSNKRIILNKKILKGKIVIISKKSIIIEPSSNLSDVICFAPYIQINEGFCGNLQVYASDSITIKENCNLTYPSVIGINKETHGNAKLSIMQNSSLYGIAFMNITDEASKSVLNISKNSIIKGQVYSNSYTEIRGAIHGTLYTKKIILRTNSSVYENTIMDADINIHKLSNNYIGTDLINEGTKGGVIKWIY